MYYNFCLCKSLKERAPRAERIRALPVPEVRISLICVCKGTTIPGTGKTIGQVFPGEGALLIAIHYIFIRARGKSLRKSARHGGGEDPLRKSARHGGGDSLRKSARHGGGDSLRKSAGHGGGDSLRKNAGHGGRETPSRKSARHRGRGGQTPPLGGIQTPHAGMGNAARGDRKRRTRGWATPHAGMTNAARGDGGCRTFGAPLKLSNSGTGHDSFGTSSTHIITLCECFVGYVWQLH